MEDNETTYAQLSERVQKTIDALRTAKAENFAGKEDAGVVSLHGCPKPLSRFERVSDRDWGRGCIPRGLEEMLMCPCRSGAQAAESRGEVHGRDVLAEVR